MRGIRDRGRNTQTTQDVRPNGKKKREEKAAKTGTQKALNEMKQEEDKTQPDGKAVTYIEKKIQSPTG